MIFGYLRAPPFIYIVAIVESQLAALFVLSAVVLALLIYRNRQAVKIENLRALYANAMIGEILHFLETGVALRQLPQPKWFEYRKRAILKTVFLEHFNSVSGPEKALLVSRYDNLFFTSEDIEATQSYIWWRRLQSVSNLSLIGRDNFAPTFERMTHDRNELVAATAFLALSSLHSDINKPRSISELPKAVLARKNLLFEILRNWSVLYGSQIIVDQIRATTDPALHAILLPVASSLQSTEIGDVYAELIRETPGLTPEAIGEMLALLRRVGDPAWIDTVRPFARHPQEVVRLRAMQYLVAVGELELLNTREVVDDPSAAIQRWRQSQVVPRIAA